MYPKPVFWHSGQFLEAQHFQETDRHHQHERAELLKLVRPFFEGVVRIAVNPAALAGGVLAPDCAELFFPDGTHVLWTGRREEGNASPIRRPLPALEEGGTLVVYVRLDIFRARHNAAGLNKEDALLADDHAERYDARPDSVETPDRYAQKHPTLSGDERIVTRLYHNVQLVWETELGDDGGMLMPIMRLVGRDGGAAVDESYIPPLASLHGSGRLVARLRKFMRALSDFPRRMDGASNGGAPALAELFTRQIAAGLLADVDTLLQWENSSPWEMFRVLRRACAEMLAAVRADAGSESVEMPLYDHRNPAKCFPALIERCEHLLARFLPEVIACVEPSLENGLLLFRLPEAAMADGALLRLAIRTEESLRVVLSEGRLIAGSPDAVRNAIRLALPQLPLSVVPAPRGLPTDDGRDGVEYLAPSVRHAAWSGVVAARCLALAYYPAHASGAERTASGVKVYVLRGGAL